MSRPDPSQLCNKRRCRAKPAGRSRKTAIPGRNDRRESSCLGSDPRVQQRGDVRRLPAHVQLQSLADWECVNQRGRSFRYPQVQLEGWLKGEALFALDKLYEERMLEDFDREVPFAEGSTSLTKE